MIDLIPTVDDLIKLAIREDLSLGDLTASLAVDRYQIGSLALVAREELVVCGLPLLSRVAEQAGVINRLTVHINAEEGGWLDDGERIATIEGQVVTLLSLERIWVNFIQRLSGVATNVRRLVEANPSLSLLDTRKTTAGWRALEKYGVRVGGGVNHRLSLGDLILIKNNHLDFAGVDTPEKAEHFFAKIRGGKPWHTPIECEVRTVKELRLVLVGEPDIIMLDNMSDELIKECLEIIGRTNRPPKVEVSGNITAERLPRLAALGVRYVSMGSLTHSVRAVDISARIAVAR